MRPLAGMRPKSMQSHLIRVAFLGAQRVQNIIGCGADGSFFVLEIGRNCRNDLARVAILGEMEQSHND